MMAKKVIIDGLEYALKHGIVGNCGEIVEIISVQPCYEKDIQDTIGITFLMPATRLRPGMKIRILVEE
jgi:hypothetical protein